MNRRGIDMSLQTIVVAVIVLFIAALLIYLVGTKLSLFNQDTGSCQARGGSCQNDCTGNLQPYFLGNTECGDSGVCCIDGDVVFGQR